MDLSLKFDRLKVFIFFLYFLAVLIIGASFLLAPKALALEVGTDVIFRTFIGDTPIPEAPINLVGAAQSNQVINLSWSPATSSATTTVGYFLYRNGVKIATLATTTFQDMGLATKTRYEYYLIAYDKFNRLSPPSIILAVTTLDVNEKPPEPDPGVVVPPIVEPPIVTPVTPDEGDDESRKISGVVIPELGETIKNLINPETITKWPENLTSAVAQPFRSGLPLSQAISETIPAPVAISLAGASGLIGLASGAGSLWEVYLLLIRQLGLLLEFFHIRKKQKPWGTVYDSVTKRPIDPAYVRVFQGRKEIATTITDIDGRFSFVLSPGIYHLTASKTHYLFPSKILAGKQSDEIYNNLYFGEDFEVKGEELIQVSIPIDPVGFDWNEFTKNKEHYFKTHYRWAIFRSYLSWFMYIVGFLISLSYVIAKFSLLNISILVLYLALFGFQLFSRIKKQKTLQVIDSSGQSLSFAVIRVFMAGVDQLIKTIVADEKGRFFVLVRPGEYYLTVESKKEDGTYDQVFRSANLNLSDGILRNNIRV